MYTYVCIYLCICIQMYMYIFCFYTVGTSVVYTDENNTTFSGHISYRDNCFLYVTLADSTKRRHLIRWDNVHRCITLASKSETAEAFVMCCPCI